MITKLLSEKISILPAMLALAVFPFLIGCEEFLDLGYHEPGTDIVFGVSDSWRNDVETRTEYSGKDQNNNSVGTSSTYERIDWVADKDRIRILCNAARNKSGANTKMADYVIYNVRMKTSDKKRSQANITSCDNNNLQWGTGWHYFYALYPAPGTVSNYNFSDYKTITEANSKAKIENVSGNKAKITGVIPATQEAVLSGSIYRPNMNYAYMYAATRFNAGSSGNVPLSFEPLVTTLEFILSKTTTGLDSKLTKLELSSTSTALTGTFTASLDVTGGTPSVGISAPAYSSSNNKITITLPGGGIALNSTKIHVTFLTLPVDQKDLKLTLTFANGALRTLFLKNINNSKVTARKKAYFDLTVPGSIPVYFDVAGPASAFSADGGSQTYKVKSYKQGNTGPVPLAWTVQYSENGGSTWTSTKPSWLTTFTASDNGSNGDFETFNVAVSENTRTKAKTWGESSTAAMGSQYNPVNLGLSNGSLNTANCYIVSQPGWYAIPMIYGNGYKNGEPNAGSYVISGGQKLFKNHDGQGIPGMWDSTWIQNVEPLYSAGFNYSSAVTVELLWEDRQGLIDVSKFDLFNEFDTQEHFNQGNAGLMEHNRLYWNAGFKGHSWAGRYFRFYVSDSIGQGNAVIAVKFNGTIVWSWHIWVIESGKVATTTVKPASGVTSSVNMMVSNLGWTDPDEIPLARTVTVRVTQTANGDSKDFTITQNKKPDRPGSNTYFQWGRKDPMLGWNYTFTAAKTQYGNTQWTRAAGPVALADGIKNPHKFYYNPDQLEYHWTTESNDYLWNTSASGINDASVTKSLYDPCPPGYKVPNRKAFTRFTAGNISGSYNNGWSFTTGSGSNTIFFPGTYLRESSNGLLGADRFAYKGGYVWTAARSTLFEFRDTPYILTDFADVNNNPIGSIAYGMAVRCVTE